MDKINKEKIWCLIRSIGDDFIGKLPHHPNYPNGRNPYAHVELKVRNSFGCRDKDIADEKYQEVADFLNYLKRDEG